MIAPRSTVKPSTIRSRAAALNASETRAASSRFSASAWSIHGPDPVQLELDVSHLVFKSAEYRAIFKWRVGKDAVEIRDVELRHDGRLVAADPRRGQTGAPRPQLAASYDTTLAQDAFGQWVALFSDKVSAGFFESKNAEKFDISPFPF